jgi:protein-L-isoaspartate(D-aspartate) O-methyltransferase
LLRPASNYRKLLACVGCAILSSFCASVRGQSEKQLTEARLKMVRTEVVEAGIKDERVIEAIRQTPRHLFVTQQQRHLAYLDMALPIGEGQTISPPFVVASMTESLKPRPTDKVLEIGTGSGYQAAVLSQVVADVYSIEIVPSLGRRAAQVLRRQGYRNVHTKIGDGYQGWAEHAPFDCIIVTCSPENPPPALVAQLKEGGRMVVPLGRRYQQTMALLTKVNGKLKAEPLEPTFFVPMTGRAEQLRVRKNDDGIPRLLNASFELTDEDEQLLGWYYVRQAEVVDDEEAMHGKRFLAFSNETAGRGAQALQAVGVNGRKIATIDLSLYVRADEVRPGRSTRELPRVNVSFFDDKQAPCGSKSAGPWYGTISWVKKQATIPVPPKAKLAVIAVGMFGATGDFAVDSVSLRVGQPR